MKRLLGAVGLMLVVSLLSFVFADVAPGDFLSEMRLNPRISPETLAALRAKYGLDQPLAVQYARWLKSAVRGDLGFSFVYDVPVVPLLLSRAANTLVLTITATVLAWALALPLGAWIGAGKGGAPIDRGAAVLTTTFLVVPDLLVALAALLLAVRTGWFPTGGMVSAGTEDAGLLTRWVDIAHHLVLPVSALTAVTLPVLVRHVRTSVAEALTLPSIIAARARGVAGGRLLLQHALRVAANPLIALFGLSLSGLLSASLVIEAVVSWPGLGPLLLDAVDARDLHVVIGAVLCSTLLLVAGTVVSDALLYALDPRIRSRET